MKFKQFYIFLISVTFVLFGCDSQEPESSNISSRGFTIEVDIENYCVPTRVNRVTEGDLWTYKSFNRGDTVGFYSKFGNSDAPDGNGSFNNIPMMYGATQSNGRVSFFNNDINFNTDNFVANMGFFYYPYGEKMDYDPGHTSFTNDGYGFELRNFNHGERCNDLIWIYAPSSVTGSVTFNHSFSSLVILRGEGFRNAENKEVKVVLDKGYSHAVIEDIPAQNYLKYFRLIYLDGYTKTEEDCRIWKAWQGTGDYTVKDKTEYNDSTFKQEWVHYVILPTQRVLARTAVEYIEIEDDYGKKHQVSNFVLYNNTRQLEHRYRFPLVIKLQNLEVKVSSLGIEEWDEETMIEESRDAGIDSPNDFQTWLNNYRAYIEEGRPESLESELSKYGDMTVTAGQAGSAKWTFYLNFDIDDVKTFINDDDVYLLEKLDDTLDGKNHTIRGLSISNQESPALIKEIGSNGVLRNLKLKDINLVTTSSSNNTTSGGLSQICKGKIENCTVSGVVNAFGPVGMIAGQISEATISDCMATGLLIGSSTQYGGLIGVDINQSIVSGGKTAGLIFQSIE